MKKLRVLAPIGLLMLASACNSDDGGGDLSDDQQAAVDQLLDGADDEGLVFDEGCVEDKAGALSDDDAAALVAAGSDGEAELSEDGEALTLELFDCVDSDALVDLFISEMEAGGQPVDEGCVRDAFDDVDLGAMFAASEGGGEIGDDPESAEALMAVMSCVDLGG